MQLGVDFASVDGNLEPDFLRAKSAGIAFAYIRRSYCYYDSVHKAYRLSHDPCYQRDAERARDAGLVVGSYLFPTFALGAPTPAEQVANFLVAGGEVIQGKDLPVALDVEFTGNGIADTHQSKEKVFSLVLEFLRELRKNFSTVAVYNSHVQWHDDNGLGGPNSEELEGVLLWQKTPYRLKAGQARDTLPPIDPHVGPLKADPHDYWRVPLPWEKQGWFMQQYQGDAVGVPGFSHTVDINRFVPFRADTKSVVRREWLLDRLDHLTPEHVSVPLDEVLKDFQRANGLTADAIVGVATFAALCK